MAWRVLDEVGKGLLDCASRHEHSSLLQYIDQNKSSRTVVST